MSTPDQPGGYPGEEAPDAGRGPGHETGPTEQDETQLLQNINNFYGQVTVEGTVGISAGARPGRRSGKVDAAEIARVERCYLAPDAQPAAAAGLRDSHVVFLVGPEGSGRAAGSLVLARQFRRDGCAIVRLPPTRTLEELTGTTFQPGAVYLVQDWTPAVEDAPSAVRFDAEQLSVRLRGAGAHLVVTAVRGGEAIRHLSAFAVAWAPVDAGRLLAHCLDRVARPDLTPADLARLTERAVQLAQPARVVELAAGLVDGVDAALAAVADTDAARVAEWFDRTLPVRRTLSAAVTLAFFSGVGLRCFEQLADDLDRLLSEAAGSDPAAAAQAPGSTPFPQTRATLVADSGLGEFLAEAGAERPFGAEQRLAFRTGHQQELFMAELFRRYGSDLWNPVRQWLAETVQRPLGPEHFAAARGLGVLCRSSPAEVTGGYLDGWAAGRTSERFTAVGILWAMAQDDLLAPLALRTAVGWARNRGQQRAMTAAVALGGVLGQRYLSEALRWLWVLALRGGRIRAAAQRALGHLLSVEADADSGSGGVPRFLASKVRPLLRPGADAAERRLALTTVVAILSTTAPDSDDPVVARLVLDRPGDVPVVAELWATAIRSGPHRGDAVAALRATLRSLARSERTAAATRLGAELLPRLQPELHGFVARTLAHPNQEPGTSGHVLRAFLDSRTGRPARPSLH